jgi:hypothetical protein
VNSFKILQDRSKTNIFVSNCEEGEKRKKTKLRFFKNKAKKNEYNRSATIEDLPLLALAHRRNNLATCLGPDRYFVPALGPLDTGVITWTTV